MEDQDEAFPELLINMVRSAETAGNLDETSMRMADYYDKQFRMHSKISNATLYPKILCFVIVVVVIFMLGYILPQFQDLFAQMEELPLPTKILFAMSDGVKEHWLMLLILLAILVPLLMFAAHIPKVRLQLDQMKLHAPIFGKLLKIVYTARAERPDPCYGADRERQVHNAGFHDRLCQRFQAGAYHYHRGSGGVRL